MKISVLMGTRPEVIKLVPVVQELQKIRGVEVVVWSSGQHQEIVNRTLSLFRMRPDLDLNVFHHSQSPSDTVGRILLGMKSVLEREHPDWVLVQGDSSTTIAGALASFYGGVKLAHLEAGLRSQHRMSPFPEEMNRRLITVLADLHFVQDEHSFSNLINEGINMEQIFMAGNPGLDLLVRLLRSDRQWNLGDSGIKYLNNKHIILVTIHRRENIGQPLLNICVALKQLVSMEHDCLRVLFPVHPNPAVQVVVRKVLGDVSNVSILGPIDYPDFIKILQRSSVVLTDSGGVQEEAIFLEKPLLILRDRTERSSGVRSELARIVDSVTDEIVQGTLEFLEMDRRNNNIERKLAEYEMAAPRIAEVFSSLLQKAMYSP